MKGRNGTFLVLASLARLWDGQYRHKPLVADGRVTAEAHLYYLDLSFAASCSLAGIAQRGWLLVIYT